MGEAQCAQPSAQTRARHWLRVGRAFVLMGLRAHGPPRPGAFMSWHEPTMAPSQTWPSGHVGASGLTKLAGGQTGRWFGSRGRASQKLMEPPSIKLVGFVPEAELNCSKTIATALSHLVHGASQQIAPEAG